MRRVITLTTDFGLDDGYVGTMKGVILGINPEAVLVDLCHNVAPQDVNEAAFVLATSRRYFPAEAIHLVVVDPGVGSKRRAIVVESSAGVFVGPDNGVLTWAAGDRLYRRVTETSAHPGLRARNIANPSYWLPHVSRTFHGRDIFAPVAAHLSNGVAPAELGEIVDQITWLRVPVPEVLGPDKLVAHVIHVDRFGNLITDLSEEDVRHLGGDLYLEIKRHRITGLSEYYGAREGLVALVGSAGFVEIAVHGGSAAQFLRVRRGESVVVRARRSDSG
ncbi:MAG: SAM-dependent chlorinase/fluorinase [Chloroflexi bacterium]|nr:SAM-dependent chlorinase/fluorinase [Chloroflexota bacterium]